MPEGRITVFDAVGVASMDMAAAKLVLDTWGSANGAGQAVAADHSGTIAKQRFEAYPAILIELGPSE